MLHPLRSIAPSFGRNNQTIPSKSSSNNFLAKITAKKVEIPREPTLLLCSPDHKAAMISIMQEGGEEKKLSRSILVAQVKEEEEIQGIPCCLLGQRLPLPLGMVFNNVL